MQTFDEVFVLTGGGPGTATLMIVHYIYETALRQPGAEFSAWRRRPPLLLGVVLLRADAGPARVEARREGA